MPVAMKLHIFGSERMDEQEAQYFSLDSCVILDYSTMRYFACESTGRCSERRSHRFRGLFLLLVEYLWDISRLDPPNSPHKSRQLMT